MKKISGWGMLLLSPLFTTAAQAGTITASWANPGSGTWNWSTPSNWIGSAVPANNAFNNYDVTIGGNGYTYVNNDIQNLAVNSLTLNGAAVSLSANNLTVSGDVTGAGNFSGYGVSLGSGAVLTVGGAINTPVQVMGSVANSPAIVQASTIGANGRIDMSSAVSNGTAFLGANGSTPITNNGGIYGAGYISGSSLVNNGVVGAQDAGGNVPSANTLYVQTTNFDNTNGTLKVAAGYTLDVQSSHFVNQQGNALNGGMYQTSGNLVLGGSITLLGANTTIDVNGAGSVMTAGGANALSTLALNQGTLNLNQGNYQQNDAFILSNTGTIGVAGYSAYATSGSLRNGGNITVDAGSSFSANGAANSGVITANGSVNLRSGATDSFGSLNSATETLTSGSYTLGTGGAIYYDAGSGAHGGAIIGIGSMAAVQLNGGNILYGGGMGNDALALLAENDGQLVIGGESAYGFNPLNGTLTNTGILGVQDSGVADFQGAIRNSGAVVLSSAELAASGIYTQTSGATEITYGTLAASASVQGGVVTGAGTVDGSVDNSGGEVAPDMGNLEVTGDYSQESGGELTDELGSGFYLKVDGDAALNGIFQGVADFGSTSPYLGETFEVLHFGGALTGNFSSLNTPSLGSGLAWQEVIGAHDITLDVVAASSTATPEPSFMWITGLALVGLGWKRRKKALVRCGDGDRRSVA